MSAEEIRARVGELGLEIAADYAFTVSLAKEFLAPYGALLAVRSRELKQRAFVAAFQAGALLEPMEGRLALAYSMRRVVGDPGLVDLRQVTARVLNKAAARR